MGTPVPYTGAPGPESISQGRIEDLPTPGVHVEAPPAAFGVNIAQAIGSLGQVTENAGKEMFDRAYAMQELHAQTNVMDHVTGAQREMSTLSADYGNLEGNNLVSAFPKYQQDIEAARVRNGAGLSPYEQALYDRETRVWQGSLTMYGARRAAEGLKSYTMGASKAQEQAADNMIQLDPRDDARWNMAVKQKLDSINHRANVLGVSADERKQMMDGGLSNAILDRVHSLGNDEPFAAREILEKAIANRQVIGDRVDKEAGFIHQRENDIGGRHIATVTVQGFSGGGPVLRALFHVESAGGQDIPNVHQTTTSGQAQGFFQITTGTWREFADRAGIDLSQYPQALGTPYAVQARMASVIPLSRWDSKTIAAMREASGGNIDTNKTLGENLAMNGEGFDVKSTPTAQMVAEGRRKALQLDPRNEDLPDAVQQRIETLVAMTKKADEDTEARNSSTIYDAIYNGVGPDKVKPTTPEQLQLNPEAKAAWDYISMNDPKRLGTFLEELKRNARGDDVLTPARIQNWINLAGEFEDNPEKFMEDTKADKLAALDLPPSKKSEILNMQKSILAKEVANPPIQHAIGLLTALGTFDNAGLAKGVNDTNRYKLIGELSEAMQVYQSVYKQPMKDDVIQSTVQNLLVKVPTQGTIWNLWQGGTQPRYQQLQDVPKDVAKTIADELTAKGQPATEDAILRVYLWAQFKELFSGSKGTQ